MSEVNSRTVSKPLSASMINSLLYTGGCDKVGADVIPFVRPIFLEGSSLFENHGINTVACSNNPKSIISCNSSYVCPHNKRHYHNLDLFLYLVEYKELCVEFKREMSLFVGYNAKKNRHGIDGTRKVGFRKYVELLEAIISGDVIDGENMADKWQLYIASVNSYYDIRGTRLDTINKVVQLKKLPHHYRNSVDGLFYYLLANGIKLDSTPICDSKEDAVKELDVIGVHYLDGTTDVKLTNAILTVVKDRSRKVEYVEA